MKIFLVLLFLFSSVYSQETPWDALTDYSNELDLTKKISKIYDATLYYSNNDYRKSLPLLKQADSILSLNKTKIQSNSINLAYANYYIEKGDFQKANDYLLKANENEPNDFVKIESAISASKIFKANKSLYDGIDILLQIKRTFSDKMSIFQKARINLQLADLYMSFKSIDILKAKKYLDEAKNDFTTLNSETGIAKVFLKKGRYFKNYLILFKDKLSEKGKDNLFKKSIFQTNNALEIFKKTHQNNNIAESYYNLALVHSVKGFHEKSVPLYKKALTIYTNLENLFKSMKINQHLFIAYSILKKQDEALKVNKRYVLLKDSIFNMEKRKLIIDAQTKFDTQKMISERQLLIEKNKKTQSIYITSILVAVMLLLTTLFYFGRYKAKKEAELILTELKETKKRLAIEKKYRSSELKALKAQMDPHFIFNALNSIQDFILLNQKNQASDYLGKFASLIRKYLHYSDKDKISIHEEIDTLKIYLELEKLRFEDKLEYKILVDKSIENATCEIPTMLIQPYVENALKHGLLHKKENGLLTIAFHRSDNEIKCTITDNGVGREKSKELNKNKSYRSFATKATKERLDLLNIERDSKIGVEIIDLYNTNNQPIGTKVIIIIPIL